MEMHHGALNLAATDPDGADNGKGLTVHMVFPASAT